MAYTMSEQRDLFSVNNAYNIIRMYRTGQEPVLSEEVGGCFKSQCPMELLEGLAVSTT